MSELYLIAGMALVTFAVRYSFFTAAGQIDFPDRLVTALRYVPPAVLTAIIVPAILMPAGNDILLSYTNPYLVAGLIAFAVGWFSRNLLLTILLGMMAFWGWPWILAAWLG